MNSKWNGRPWPNLSRLPAFSWRDWVKQWRTTSVRYYLGPKFEPWNPWERSSSAEHAATCFSSCTEMFVIRNPIILYKFPRITIFSMWLMNWKVVCNCIVTNRVIIFMPNIVQKYYKPMTAGCQILRSPHSLGSQNNAVGVATGYGLDDRGVGVRVLVESRIFSSPRRPDRLWGPSSLYRMGNGGSFSGGKETVAWSWPLTFN
jgi:hypothetical protein